MNITVFKPAGRKNYVCQWVDAVTGRKKTRTTGTPIKRDAERIAGNLQRDLDSGTYHEDVRMTWETFRQRFSEDYLSGSPSGTVGRYNTMLNGFERIISPKLLQSINESVISRYSAGMRKRGNSEATVKSNLVHLKAALNWAVDQKFIPVAPKVRLPKNADAMKGRPITGEEFERMLAKLPTIQAKDPDEWRFFLWGL